MQSRKTLIFASPLMVIVALLTLVAVSFAQEPEPVTDAVFVSQDDLQITAYYRGFGIVTDTRTFELSEGLNRVVFDDIQTVLPVQQSVVLDAAPDIRLVRQAVEPARTTGISQDQLLNDSVGQTITLTITRGEETLEVTGVLLALENGELLIQEDDGGLQRVFRAEIRRYDLPVVPEATATTNRLTLYVRSMVSGPQALAVTYVIPENNLSWSVNYTLQTNADDNRVNINGWITVYNNMGTLENVRLALAGGRADAVQFIGRESNFVGAVPTQTPFATPTAEPTYDAFPRAGGSIVSIPSDERFLLELPTPITLHERANTVFDFLSEIDLAAENVYIYDASPRVVGFTGFITEEDYGFNETTSVQNFLSISRTDGAGLGLDLPGGPLSLYRENANGTTETLGITQLPYTPRDAVLQIYLDNSTEITGSRTQSEFIEISPDVVQETVNITLSNRGASGVLVTVPERMARGANWELLGTSQPFTELGNGSGIEFMVDVPANGTATITYQVVYRR